MNASLLTLALGAGAAILFVKMKSNSNTPAPASLPTSSSSLWPSSTFTGALPSGAVPENGFGSAEMPAVGRIAALQDTLHGGKDGSIIAVEVTGVGSGVVRSVISTNPAPGSLVQNSPIKTGDVALFDASEVIASQPDLGSMLAVIQQM